MIKLRHVSHVKEDLLARSECVQNPDVAEQGRRVNSVCTQRKGEWKNMACYRSELFTKSAESSAVSSRQDEDGGVEEFSCTFSLFNATQIPSGPELSSSRSLMAPSGQSLIFPKSVLP